MRPMLSMSLVLVTLMGCFPYFYGQELIVNKMESAATKDANPKGKEQQSGKLDTKKDLKQLRPSVVSGRYAGPRSRRTAEEAVEAAADEEEKGAALAYVTVYHCDSLEPVGTGALRTRFGGSLGLPGFFEYEEGEAGPTDEEMARMVHKTVSGLFSKGWQLFGGSPGEASPLSKLPRSDLDDLRSSFVHSKEAKQFAVAFEAFRLREKSIELLAFIPILSYLTFAVIAAGIDEKIVKKMGPRYTAGMRVGLFASVFVTQAAMCVMSTSLCMREGDEAALRAMARAQPPELARRYAAGAAAYADESRRRGLLLRRLAPLGEGHFEEDGSLTPGWMEMRGWSKHEMEQIFKEEMDRAKEGLTT